LSAASHEPKLHKRYEGIHEKNPKIKMIGAVAVQRKPLVLIYTLYKKMNPTIQILKTKSGLSQIKAGKT